MMTSDVRGPEEHQEAVEREEASGTREVTRQGFAVV